MAFPGIAFEDGTNIVVFSNAPRINKDIAPYRRDEWRVVDSQGRVVLQFVKAIIERQSFSWTNAGVTFHKNLQTVVNKRRFIYYYDTDNTEYFVLMKPLRFVSEQVSGLFNIRLDMEQITHG